MQKTILDENPRLKKIIDAAEEQPSPAIALTIATVQRNAKESIYSINEWNKEYKLQGKVGHFISVMRRPETNVTHPNILSAPTDRIPVELLNAMTNGFVVKPSREPIRDGYTFFAPRAVSSNDESGHHPVIYAVDNILAKKMGVAEVLESGQFTYRAWIAALLNGDATYPLYRPFEHCADHAHEPMRMANIFVEVDEASMERIPRQSQAYSEIRKLTPKDFKDRHWYGAKGGEFLFKPGSRNQLQSDYIDGLCLPSTIAVLNQFEEPLIKEDE